MSAITEPMSRTATILAIAAVITLMAVGRVYQDSYEHLSSTDFGTYFEIIANPAFYRFTLDEAYQAFMAAPTSFLSVAKGLTALGFDVDNDKHSAIFAGIVTALEILAFVVANFILMTSLGVNGLIALSIVLFVAKSRSFGYYGRFFPVRAIFTSPYLSLFCNAGAVLGISLFIARRDRLALFWSGLLTTLHAVVGPLSALFMLTSAFFEKAVQRTNPFRSRHIWVLSTCFILASASFWYKLLTNPSGITSEFNRRDFIEFAMHRSANTFPLADGISEVICAFAYLTLAFHLLPPKPHNRPTKRLGHLSWFLLATYLAQIIGADVLKIPLVISLALHRFSPLYVLVFLWFFAISLQRAINRRDLPAIVAMTGVMLVNYLPDSNFFSEAFVNTERVFWIAVFVLAARIGGPHARLGRMLLAITLLGAMIAAAVANILSVWFADTANYGSWPGIETSWGIFAANIRCFSTAAAWRIGGLVALVALLRYSGGHTPTWTRKHLPGMAQPATLMFVLFFSLTFIMGQTYLAGKHLTAPPRMEQRPNRELVDFLEQHTSSKDGIFVVFQSELGGVRRQYLEWKAAWLTLYAKQSFPSLWQKMRALEMDIGPDSFAHRNCRLPYRLFIERCMLTRGLQLDPLYNSKGWVRKVDAMKIADPHLNHVLLRTGDEVPCDRINCRVVAKSDKYILLKL